MAQSTFVANSTVVATTTSAVCTYPAGFAANDLLVMMVSSDSGNIGTPASWTQVGTTVTGGGTSVAIFKKAAAGSETGSVTSTITGGTKGVALMAAYRPPAGGFSADVQASSTGIDNDSTSTAISVTGSTMTAVTDDLLVLFGLISANGGAFTGNATGPAITMAGTTLGTQTARAAARASTNTLYYSHRDVSVTAGGSGAPVWTATAAGANASGAAAFFAIRTVSAMTAPTSSATVPASARVDETYTITDTSTATTAGATIVGRTWRLISGGGTLSSTTASSVIVTAPPLPGTPQVIGITAMDSNGLPGTEQTYSIAINPGPGANAGPDQLAVESLDTVQLAGSGTSSPTVWSWRQVSGQVVTLSSTTAQSPTFRAPASVDGLDLVFGLSVGVDGGPLSAEDTVKIHIRPHIEWYISANTWLPMFTSAIT